MSHELLELNKTTEDQLVMIREFTAPKSVVFAAITQPQHLKHWACPKGMKITFAQAELKVGGEYSYGMQAETGEGPEMILSGKYKEIDEPHKVVFTQTYKSPDGTKSEKTLITITLEDIGDKTQMIFHHTGFAEKQGRDNASMGWGSAFDKLEKVVDELASSQ